MIRATCLVGWIPFTPTHSLVPSNLQKWFWLFPFETEIGYEILRVHVLREKYIPDHYVMFCFRRVPLSE